MIIKVKESWVNFWLTLIFTQIKIMKHNLNFKLDTVSYLKLNNNNIASTNMIENKI